MADHITADGVTGPMGVRFSEEEGICEVQVYLPPVELIGGAVDGETVAPGFLLDLEGLRSLFERVDDFSWQAFGLAGTTMARRRRSRAPIKGTRSFCKCWRTHPRTKSRGRRSN